jgi:hypothetical protein
MISFLFGQKLSHLLNIKDVTMFSNVLFQYCSISQWLLFLGIALILWGWLEKKEKVLLVGQILFLLLGLFAVWILLANTAQGSLPIDGKITKEMKVHGFFKGVMILAAIDLFSLMLNLFKSRFRKASYVFVVLVALMLFFMVFNILQIPA